MESFEELLRYWRSLAICDWLEIGVGLAFGVVVLRTYLRNVRGIPLRLGRLAEVLGGQLVQPPGGRPMVIAEDAGARVIFEFPDRTNAYTVHRVGPLCAIRIRRAVPTTAQLVVRTRHLADDLVAVGVPRRALEGGSPLARAVDELARSSDEADEFTLRDGFAELSVGARWDSDRLTIERLTHLLSLNRVLARSVLLALGRRAPTSDPRLAA